MEKGFTVMEVLVALAILSIIMLAFSNILSAQINNINLAARQSTAFYQGQDTIENIMAYPASIVTNEKVTDVDHAYQVRVSHAYQVRVSFSSDPEAPNIEVIVPGMLVEVDTGTKKLVTWIANPHGGAP